LKKLKAGLEEEIKSYESMLRISLDERKVLQKEAYSRELVLLASEKLRLMNRINQISLLLNPLKAMWVQNREMQVQTPMEKEISPLIRRLGNVLEELFTIDGANTRKLADITKINWKETISNTTEQDAAAPARSTQA